MVSETQIENVPEEMGEETTTDDSSTVEESIEVETDASKTEVETDASKTEAETESETDDSAEETAEEEEEEPATEEREFDKNPTILYALVQKKLWKEAIARAKSNPEEAHAFIVRKEKDGRIRWRLLPIHAAIVFKAPESVVEALLTAFPKGSEEKDDQGMLPLHLAFRNVATEGTVNMLLMAFPQSVETPDRKGRVPLTLAKAASDNSEIYTKLLEKGSSHYAIAALTSARERVEAEQKEIFETKLEQARKFHDCALSEVEAAAEKTKTELEAKLSEKEEELAKIHENSQVLVDHVTSLEAQMNTRSDTERFLATKIAKLELGLKDSIASKEEREIHWQSTVADMEQKLKEIEKSKDASQNEFDGEKTNFYTKKTILETKVENLENDLSSTRAELAQALETMEKKEAQWEQREVKLEEKTKQIEVEWASAQANCAILDSQLKKRIENEHLLASQVSTLASRLVESTDTAMRFTREIKELEENQFPLEATIQSLTKRLESITATMEATRQHQMAVLDDAILQEEMMAKSMENHAKMVSGSLEQEKTIESVKSEMMQLIERSFTQMHDQRVESLRASTEQGQFLSNMNGSRRNMLSSVQTVTANIIDALNTELNLTTVKDDVEKMKAEQQKKKEERATYTLEETRDEPEEVVAEEATLSVETANKETLESDECIEVASPKKIAQVVQNFEAPEETPAEKTSTSGPITAE